MHALEKGKVKKQNKNKTGRSKKRLSIRVLAIQKQMDINGEGEKGRQMKKETMHADERDYA